jgi:hypothetical protein
VIPSRIAAEKKLPARKTAGRYETKNSSALRFRGLHFSGQRLAGQYTQPYRHETYRHAEHHVEERQQDVARANAAKCLKLKCGKCGVSSDKPYGYEIKQVRTPMDVLTKERHDESDQK